MAIGKTHLDPFIQIVDLGGALGDVGSANYDDQVASGSGMETTGSSLADNFNAAISQINMIINGTKASNDWFTAFTAPTTFEGGAIRGAQSLNDDLHDLERKRILKRVSAIGLDVPVTTAATSDLTSTGVNVSNLDTVTIDTKTYTFQTTLTNVDGNVQIGVDAATSLSNLAGAINLTGTPGTDYAAATTVHPTVYSSGLTATVLTATAKVQGSAADSIATTEAAVTLSWPGATLGAGTGGGATTDVVVLAPTQLPTTTTAAIDAVTTLGLVCATAGTFGTASLDEVTGANALQPKSLWVIIDSATGEALLDTGGDQVWGLAQCQSAVDGSTITGGSGNGLQFSLVKRNGTGDDLELITAGDVPITATVDYAYVRRDAFEDCPEEAWLGEGFVDTGVSNATRQVGYDNQGTAVVSLGNNATLDLQAGIAWEIGDAAGLDLFTITEGSGGGTSTILYGLDVDVADFDQVDTDFLNGITVGSTTTGIEIAETAGVINRAAALSVQTTGANLTLQSVTSGDVIVASAGDATVDGAVVSVDGTDTMNFTMSATDAGTKTMTIAATNAGAGEAALDIDASSVTIDANTTVVDITATTSVDIVTGTTATVTAGTEVVLLSGSSNDVDITAGLDIDMAAECLLFDPADLEYGHHHWRTPFHMFGAIASAKENYLTINASPVPSTAMKGGLTVVTNANTYTPGSVLTGSNAQSGADAFFDVSAGGGTPGLTVGDFLVAEGCSPSCLDGLWQVSALSADRIDVVGFSASPALDCFKTDMPTDASATGTLYKADICVLRCNGGNWEVADGDAASALSFVALATAAGSDFQATYDASSGDNPMILATAADGAFSITTTVNDVVSAAVFTAGAHTATTAGDLVTMTTVANSSGDALAIVNAGSGAGIDLNNSGSGVGLDLNNTGSAAALVVSDAAGTRFTVNSAGGVASSPASGEDHSISTTGSGGDITGTSAAGAVTFTGFTGSTYEADGSVTGTILTTVQAVNSGVTAADAARLNLYANEDGTSGATTSDVYIDALGTSAGVTRKVNIGTQEEVTVTSGNTTGATQLIGAAGTGAIQYDATGALAGTMTNQNTVTNSDNTAASTATNTFTATASGASGAVLANVNVNAVVGNATGTATGNFMADGTNTGIVVANFATGGSAASNTINGANAAGVQSVIDFGTSVSTSTFDVTAGGTSWAAENKGSLLIYPNHGSTESTNLDPTSDTATGSYEATAGFMAYNNSTFGDAYVAWGAGFNGYNSTTSTTSGEVHIVNTVLGAGSGTSVTFTAGVGPAVNAPSITVGVGEGATFTAGNFIAVFNASERNNNKIFRIISIASDVLTLYGVGGTAVTEEWLAGNVVGGADTGADIREVTLSIWRQNAGVFEFAESVTGGSVTYTSVASGTSTFQEVYTTSAPNTPSFTTTAANGTFSIEGTVDDALTYASIELAAHTTPTATTALAITGTANSSGSLVSITDTSTESGNAFFVDNSGDGPAVIIQNTSTGNAFRVTDGIIDHVVVGPDGTFTWTGDSNADFTVNATGASGFVDINVGAAGFDVTATAGPVDLTTTGAADITFTSGQKIDVVAADEVDIQSDCVGIHANAAALDTSSFHSEMERFQLWGSSATASNGAYIGHNIQRTSTTALGAGSVVVLNAVVGVSSSVTATTASVAATTDPTVTVASSASFAAGMLVSLSGTANECNPDVYEVAATPTGTTVTLRGPNGVTARTLGFTGLDLVTAGAGGTIQQVNVSVIQSDSAGNWQQGVGDDDTITFTNFQGATSIQQAWVNSDGTTAVLGDNATMQVTDADVYRIESETGNHTLLQVAALAAGDVVTVGEDTGANAVNLAAGTGGVNADTSGPVSLDSTGTSSNLTITNTGTGTVVNTFKTEVTGNGGVAEVRIEANESNATAGTSNIEIEAFVTGPGGGGATIAMGVESTATLNLGTGAFTQTANFNTGGAAKTTSIGSGNTTSTTSMDGGSGGVTVTATGGTVGVTGDTGVSIASTDAADGSARDVTIDAADSSTAATAGANIIQTSGAPGAAGTPGVINLRNASSANVGQTAPVVTFTNQGSDTGGGQAMSLYTGTAAPTHSAPTGSVFLFDNGTIGRMYLNESSGGSGTTWSLLDTASAAVTRNFFQDTITGSAVSPGGTLVAGSFTGGVIAVKPSTDFTFDFDADIYLNGVLLMNGSGNEVTSGAGNGITVEAAGPTFNVGDVVTIRYSQNGTNNTA